MGSKFPEVQDHLASIVRESYLEAEWVERESSLLQR